MWGQAVSNPKRRKPVPHNAMEQMTVRLTASVETLAQVVEALRTDFKSHEREQKSLEVKLGRIEQSLLATAQEFTNLTKLVRDGNGQPSLFQRVTEHESDIETIRNELGALAAVKAQIAGSAQLTKGQVIAGVLGMLIAIFTAIASALLTVSR